MELRGLTIPYAKRKARKGREKQTKIQKRMEELDNLISNPANTNDITCQIKAEYITLKEDLCLIYENKAKAQLSASKQNGSNKVKILQNTFSIWKKGTITVS